MSQAEYAAGRREGATDVPWVGPFHVRYNPEIDNVPGQWVEPGWEVYHEGGPEIVQVWYHEEATARAFAAQRNLTTRMAAERIAQSTPAEDLTDAYVVAMNTIQAEAPTRAERALRELADLAMLGHGVRVAIEGIGDHLKTVRKLVKASGGIVYAKDGGSFHSGWADGSVLHVYQRVNYLRNTTADRLIDGLAWVEDIRLCLVHGTTTRIEPGVPPTPGAVAE